MTDGDHQWASDEEKLLRDLDEGIDTEDDLELELRAILTSDADALD